MSSSQQTRVENKTLATTVIVVGFLVLLLVTACAGSALFWLYPPADGKAATDLIRTAASLGIGTGGAAALLLTARRQQMSERVAEDNRHDATERRITELQGQAGEQLGSDKAAVRLNGLYQLERLANEHPDHRQTIVNVICAYMRMPFREPQPVDKDIEYQDSNTRLDQNGDETINIQLREELQVRLTAQRILTSHLHPESKHYWGTEDAIEVDLTGAILIDFEFQNCRARAGYFQGARFEGAANFAAAHFSGQAMFANAIFGRDARFDGAQFCSGAIFNNATITRDAAFRLARFDGLADFGSVKFMRYSVFDDSNFNGYATFEASKFLGDASFTGVRVTGDILFGTASFDGYAVFSGATGVSELDGRVIFSPGWQFREPEVSEGESFEDL